MTNKFNFDQPGNKDVFKVPEQYFENLQSEIQNRIAGDAAPLQGRRLFMNRVKPVLYMAAVFVVLLFSIRAVLNLTNTDKKQSVISKIDGVEMEEFQVNTMTAEEILLSSLDEYSLMYYYINQDELE
ncbi:MAG: hypothetical protein GX841_00530 [Bacteroidales bacterium]|nr:hypothetical protein [Bacteroidales bacterium]